MRSPRWLYSWIRSRCYCNLHSGNLYNIAMQNGPGLKMYFLFKMGIFQPAMLVYQRVMNWFFDVSKVMLEAQITHDSSHTAFNSLKILPKPILPDKRNGKVLSSLKVGGFCWRLSYSYCIYWIYHSCNSPSLDYTSQPWKLTLGLLGIGKCPFPLGTFAQVAACCDSFPQLWASRRALWRKMKKYWTWTWQRRHLTIV